MSIVRSGPPRSRCWPFSGSWSGATQFASRRFGRWRAMPSPGSEMRETRMGLGAEPWLPKSRLKPTGENAARSTGPRSVAGKARSKMNALRHGLAARLDGALSEGFLDIEELSDRMTQIEAERVRLCQEIERGLEQGVVG